MKTSLLALLGAALAIACGQAATAAETGSPVPGCSLNALGDSQRYDTRRFRDKVLYVDFWASWCGPCAKAFPFLNQLHNELNERGLQVIGVNLDEKPGDAERFLARYPAGFPIVSDPAGRCAKSFDVEAMPSSYLIGRDGVLRHVHRGFRSGDAEELRRIVEQLLAETPTSR